MDANEDSPEALERFHASLELVEIVARQVGRTVGRNVEFDELKSFGREGLLRAARRFDSGRGVPFRAYASFRVRGAMIDGIRQTARLPRRVHERLKCLESANQYSESISEDTLGAAPPGETASTAQRLLNEHLAGMATAMAIGLVSEAAVADDGELTTVATDDSPEQALEQAQLGKIMRELVSELPEQEAELVQRHYFNGERFDHVATELGLSKSWASRLHSRAIGRLTKRARERV